MEKEEARKIVFQRREQIRQNIVEDLNSKIFANTPDFKNKIIGGYHNFEKEASILEVLKFYKKYNTILLPKTLENKIYFAEWNFVEKLKPNSLYKKILEPSNNIEKIPEIVFVPCVAVSLNGDRVGYGKAYYDKYLSNINCLKICVAFEFQIFNSIKADNHDIKMDYILTEERFLPVHVV
ncbi:MAG: 5-formyltetrahydrofolate cyclo-ligase [Rickettsiales bacterium]|nr:5-formyltetrahydrofolate cyclo-ligase [Rickettsiales bacterium]